MPADLTIFALDDDASADAAELCLQSSHRDDGGRPVSLRFHDRVDAISPRAAAYKQAALGSDWPAELAQRVSCWVRAEPADRVLLVWQPDRELADRCIDLFKMPPMADSRIVLVTTPALLPAHLPEGMRIAFQHMPTRSEENIRRSVDYSLSMLNSLGSTQRPQLPPPPKVRTDRVLLTSDSGHQSHAMLRSRGAPLRFAVPFVGDGFRLNSTIASERTDGIFVSADTKGTAIFGPYLPVSSGRYQALAKIRGAARKSRMLPLVQRRITGDIAFDAYIGDVDKVLKAISIDAIAIEADPMWIELNFDVPALREMPQLELRLHQQSNRAIILESIELTWLE